MCRRFTQRYTWHEIHELFGLTGPAHNPQAHYNSAPTDPIDVVRSPDGGAPPNSCTCAGAHDLLVEKPLKQLPATFDARAEVRIIAAWRGALAAEACSLFSFTTRTLLISRG
jgi:putative SOS response-associated peptidase YedK